MHSYKLTPIQASCPVCHGTEARILYSVSGEEAALHVLGYVADERRFSELVSCVETLWRGDHTCDFVRCVNCSFCFASPCVPGDSRFYTLAYDQPGRYAAWKWDYQVTYETLQKLVAKRDFRLLEIGAGNGTFVQKIAPALIPKENVLCIEYSECGVREINNYGIECLSHDILQLDRVQYRERFDVVCMFQVLEHMSDPDALFECLTHSTGKRAHLFIAVPNAKQREFFDLQGIREDIPPTHIGRWNKRCFETMAARYGWVVIRHEIEPSTLMTKVIRLVSYRFVRSTLADRINRMSTRSLRRLLKATVLGSYILGSLPTINALRSRELGISQWVHLMKAESIS
jgi:SAM-dependent methyltransferase